MRGVTHPVEVIDEALRLSATGLSDYEVAARLQVARSTVQNWRRSGRAGSRLRRPAPWVNRPISPLSYAYLLGVYLGDGHLARHGGTWGLTVTLDSKYPDIVDECKAAMLSSVPAPVRSVDRQDGATRLVSCRRDWRSLFPQHGPGRKHLRRIELVGWQLQITRRWPRPFLRGLIHSDGSRCINRFSTGLPSGRTAYYEYPRYFFTNLSADIRRIFCDHCELLGIRWTQSNWKNISISHRDSVALLDEFVGPKS